MLDHSLLDLEMNYLRNGKNSHQVKNYHIHKTFLLKRFLEIQLLLENGVSKDYQLIIYQLRMVSFVHKQRDGHYLLIHNLKEINGLRVWKKKITAKSQNFLIQSSSQWLKMESEWVTQ